MKAVCKRLFSLMLVAVLLISAIPFAAGADTTKVTVAYKTSEFGQNIIDPYENVELGHLIKGTDLKESVVKKAYAAYERNLDDNETVIGWQAITESGNIPVTMGKTRVSVEMLYREGEAKVIIVPIIGYKPTNITLDAKGGKVNGNATVKHPVMLGETYGQRATLPTATRDHYTFDGWFIKNADGSETWLTNDTPVASYDNAYAKWTEAQYRVKIYKYDIENSKWADEAVAAVPGIKAGSTTTSVEANIENRAKEAVALDGFEIVGWERVYSNGKTEAFNFSTTKVYAEAGTDEVSVRPIYQTQITLDMTDATNLANRKHTVQIGKPINHKGSLHTPDYTNSGKVFMGWQAGSAEEPEERWDVDQTKIYDPYTFGYTFYAEWGTPATIRLHLCQEDSNGKYKTLGIYKNYQVPTDKDFELKNVNLSDKVSGYDKNNMVFYDDVNWDKLEAGIGPVAKVEKIDAYTLEPGKIYHYYVVLTEASNSGNSGSTSGTQATTPTKTPSDPTNAQTGDSSMIYVSMGTMITAAAALMVVMQLRKKEII